MQEGRDRARGSVGVRIAADRKSLLHAQPQAVVHDLDRDIASIRVAIQLREGLHKFHRRQTRRQRCKPVRTETPREREAKGDGQQTDLQ